MGADVQKNENDNARRELILFGTKQLLHSLLNWGIVLLLGFAWKMSFLQILVFYASYSLLRVFAGGFHAETRWGCYLASIVCLNLCFASIQYLEWGSGLIIGLNVINICVIFFLSPVENPKKILSSAERMIFQKRTKIVLLAEAVFLLLTYCLHLTMLTKGITVGICLVSIMEIMGSIQIFYLTNYRTKIH